MSKKLLTELRSFAETTSVRGIPRVMKAKTRVTFVVWLVAVLTCAALLVWQLSVVLTRYFQYPVSTLTVQAPAWQTPTFPDITVCNLDPAIYQDINMFNSDSVLIASLNKSFSCTTDELPALDGAFDDWLDFESYLVYVSAAWDPIFYKCFTLRPDNSSVRENIRGLRATMYVDQVNEPISEDDLYPGALEATGLRVLVHAPGTAPDMTFGIDIAPGTETNILLTQSVRTRLGQPYSNCTDKSYLPWDNTSDAYTQPYCVNTCIQQYIVDHCGCVSENIHQYTMVQLRKVNFLMCGLEIANFSAIPPNCFYNLPTRAYMTQFANVSAGCSEACVLPCSELQYDAAVSLAPWPRTAELALYSFSYLSDLRFSYLFNISASETAEEKYAASTTPTATDFFKSRFLSLNIQFGSQSFVELKDVAAFSVDAMGAQIGGVLSLWLGVTAMFAFEAFEFLYVYLTHNCRKEESAQIDPTSTAPSAGMELSQSVVLQIE